MPRLAVFFMLAVLLSCGTNLAQRAQKAYQQGNWPLAIDLYQQVIAKSPHPQYVYNLSLAFIANQKPQEALLVLSPLLQKYPENMLLLRAAMIASFETKKYDQTQEYIQKILNLNAYDFYARMYQLYILYQKKDYQNALSKMKAFYKETQDPRIMLAIAQVLDSLDERKEAIFWMEQYVKKEGKAADFFLLATWQIETRNYLQASENLLQGLSRDNNPRYRFQLARLQLLFLKNEKLGLGNLQQALQEGYANQKDFQELLNHPRLVNREDVEKMLRTTKPKTAKKS